MMQPQAYQLLAPLLEYPTARLWEQVGNCISALQPECAEAAARLKSFEFVVTQGSLGQVQELYTSTFDMRAECSLYVGHHMFGDDPRRGLFMAKLKEDYRKHGVSCGNELPDHLPVVLRYLASREPGEDTQDLIVECVKPTLVRITLQLERVENPYAAVLQALGHVLGEQESAMTAVAGG